MDEQRQLTLPETELERLKDRIWQDFLAARSNHDSRIERFRRYYRIWRGLQETKGSKDGPDFQVPLLKWVTLGNWARTMQALLGDDAEIIAKPTAPLDEKIASKVGHYETWRFFEYMQATDPLSVWVFRSMLNGCAHAEMIYDQEYYWERGKDGKDKEVLCYDGPRITALWPSQIIVPAQDEVRCIDDFEWVIRRRRVTPQMLLDGERRGRYQGVRKNWNEIWAFSQMKQERDYTWDDERIDADSAEGVDHSTMLGNRDSLDMWEWYGKWRPLKGKRDVGEQSLFYRYDNPMDLRVSFLPRAMRVVGVQDLRDVYPKMRKRNPFLDMRLVKDGSYWCPGLGEMLEEMQSESTINHALMRRAGMFSVGPVIFYRAASGLDPETFEYKPNTMIPSEDPAGVNVVNFKADLAFCEMYGQLIKTMAELLTGFNDQTVGQQVDRPNAPRTLGGQMLLAEGANTRVSLDMTMLREDLSRAIGYCWTLDREYSDAEVFFRVTEEDAGGLYDVSNGFGTMTSEEREHDFDFQLKFASSVWSKEAKKQAMLALYQISLQNPIVQQNPRALWVLLNRVWAAFGEANFKEIIPEPPELDTPMSPKDEWAEMQKGEEVHVNPLDDDDQHIIDHRRRLEQEVNLDEDRRDKRLEAEAVQHIIEHEHQKRQKMLLQALAQQAVSAMQQQGQPGAQMAGGGLPPPAPIPGSVPALPVPPVAAPAQPAQPAQNGESQA